MLAKRIFLIVFILVLSLPHFVLAAGVFNKNFIISDEEFFDPDGMTLGEVQSFLESHHSALATYVAPDVDGALRSAAEMIWRTAVAFKVNPKFFLVLLQKEQSLIDAQHLTQYQLDWATGFARCDTCSQDHPTLQDKKGLATQLYNAAAHIRDKYVSDIQSKGKTAAGFGPGVVKRVDGQRITPQNKVTAILYTYTPHIAGNKHFWQLWNSWFSPLYPDGALLQDKKTGGVWLIENGQRRPFLSKTALTSRYSLKDVIIVESADLERYPAGAPIEFADHAVLKSDDGKLYFVDGNMRREVISAALLRAAGYNPDKAIGVTAVELANLAVGDPIGTGPAYPLGALLQDVKTGGVFFAINNTKHPIVDRQILSLYYHGQPIIKTTEAKLALLTTAEPMTFNNGEMVGIKKTGQVYFISDNLRRPVTKDTLQLLGFDTGRIIWSSETVLNLYPVGAPIVFITTSPTALAVQSGAVLDTTVTTAVDAGSGINATTASTAADDMVLVSTDANEGVAP